MKLEIFTVRNGLSPGMWIKVNGNWRYLFRVVDRNGEVRDVMRSPHRSWQAAKRLCKRVLKQLGIVPKSVYTDKNNALIKPVKEVLKAKHRILHITVTPVERSHVPIKRRYSVMRSSGSFIRTFRFTWNWEAIYGYCGNLNASTHRGGEEFFLKSRWLFGLE